MLVPKDDAVVAVLVACISHGACWCVIHSNTCVVDGVYVAVVFSFSQVVAEAIHRKPVFLDAVFCVAAPWYVECLDDFVGEAWCCWCWEHVLECILEPSCEVCALVPVLVVLVHCNLRQRSTSN